MKSNFAPKEFPSVTAVSHQMVLRAPSGVGPKTIAEVIGKPYQTLMSELSQQQGHKLGADLLLALMDAANSNAPLEFMARERQCVLVEIPSVTIPGCEDLMQPLSIALTTFSDWFKTISNHMADGVIANTERTEFDERCTGMIEALIRFQKTYHAVNAEHNKQRGVS